MHDDELQWSQDAHQHERVANQAVPEPAPPSQRGVLGDRERGYVTAGAPVEVARVCVVRYVNPLQVVVGREGQHRDYGAYGVAHALRREVGTVAAVVLNDDQPHHQTRGRQGDDRGRPVADLHAPEQQGPRGAVQDQGDGKLQQTATVVRPLVGRQNRSPAFLRGRLADQQIEGAGDRGGRRGGHSCS